MTYVIIVFLVGAWAGTILLSRLTSRENFRAYIAVIMENNDDWLKRIAEVRRETELYRAALTKTDSSNKTVKIGEAS